MFRSLMFTGVALLSMVTGCAVSDAEDGTAGDDPAFTSGGAKCTQVIEAKNKHVANLAVKEGKLTIEESSINGDFAPVTYNLSRVFLFAAPSEKPKYECGAGAGLRNDSSDVPCARTPAGWNRGKKAGATYTPIGGSATG